MDEPTVSFQQMAKTSRRFAQRLFTIGENRLELLAMEVQEERARLLHAILLALSVGVLGLLAGMALTAAIVVGLWAYSPVVVLLILTGLYGLAAALMYRQLMTGLREWQTLAESINQLRKDRACLEKFLA
jgi:uncharacterized membrane protein YqjE